ncbi:unnamed protein product [Parnassius apollo]|uniref:(apollo) hypothetical protein n=1 Tax=Parnassius apollo TaxID=110799 RepID=A0A8S3WYP8_PARAO|nr:unnamed protein product [Parnassius apollo]
MSEQEALPMDTMLPQPLSSTSSENGSVSTTASTVPQAAAHNRPTTLSKPSGLKPPTKIGRLCSNSAPKPAVPISPRTDDLANEKCEGNNHKLKVRIRALLLSDPA